jgi:hypothetical protein
MKTIKEAIEEYIGGYDSDFYEADEVFPYSARAIVRNKERAFAEGVAFAQTWIPVEEEMPKNGQLVLIKNKEGDISTARYCENLKSKFAIDFDEMSDKNITHWRPIEFE